MTARPAGQLPLSFASLLHAFKHVPLDHPSMGQRVEDLNLLFYQPTDITDISAHTDTFSSATVARSEALPQSVSGRAVCAYFKYRSNL